MQRRTFFTTIFGSFAGFACLRATKSDTDPSYTYSFGRKMWTTNPKHEGKLTRGPHNHVYCDGVDAGLNIVRFQTGPAGWVEYVETDDGGWVKGPDGHPVTRILRGHIRYVNDYFSS